ncbi:MAG: hypothetical protein DI537_08770 [Stutzerimonas stutzeri]|nr:MAG: hypothetical protein DI537_08770 [Stutzerimonas stutzeri]
MSVPAPRREDQPDGSVKIIFAAPILDIDQPKKHLTLRPPTIRELWEIGDPLTYVFSEAGAVISTIDRPSLRAWASRLIEGHDADLIGEQRDVALGLLIEEAILGFFQSARRRLKPQSAPSSEAA